MCNLQCSNKIKHTKMSSSQMEMGLNSVINRGTTYIIAFQFNFVEPYHRLSLALACSNIVFREINQPTNKTDINLHYNDRLMHCSNWIESTCMRLKEIVVILVSNF